MGYSFLDFVSEIDQTTIDNETLGYPYIQWVNGNRQLRTTGGVPYTGGWALPCNNINVEELEGWTRGTLEHSDGSTDVWFIRDITVAVVRTRRSWQVRGWDGRSQMFAWDQYEEAKAIGQPRGRLQALCMVQSIDPLTYGPFVLTMRGSYARAVTDTVLPTFAKSVIMPANTANARRGVKAKFPARAFWLSIGPDRNANGEPRFTTVGKAPNTQSVVLPIALNLADKLSMEQIGKRFVGSELLALGTALYLEAEQWATALDQAPATAREEVTDMPPEGDEEELPF